MRQGIREIDRHIGLRPVDEARIDESISNMQRSLADLAPQLALVGDELKGLAQDLGQKLEGARNRLGQVQRQSRILEEITDGRGLLARRPEGHRRRSSPRRSRPTSRPIPTRPARGRSRTCSRNDRSGTPWTPGASSSAGWKPTRRALTAQEAKARAAPASNSSPSIPTSRTPSAVARLPTTRGGHRRAEHRASRTVHARDPAAALRHPRRQRLDGDGQRREARWATSSRKRYYTTKPPGREEQLRAFQSLIIVQR